MLLCIALDITLLIPLTTSQGLYRLPISQTGGKKFREGLFSVTQLENDGARTELRSLLPSRLCCLSVTI